MSDDGGEDGDRLLNIFGGALLLFLLIAVVVVVLAAGSGPYEQPGDVPETEWSIDRVNTTHVKITLEGGETVETDALVVTVSGTEVDPAWSGRLTEGDSGIVRAEPGAVVRIYWVAGSEDRVGLVRLEA
ncbi:MAG: hypothetical protein ABEH65_09030 [Halobacteriales archaeon]